MATSKRISSSFLLGMVTSWLLIFTTVVLAGNATDTLTWGGSNDRNGYETNHNMDPSVVGSPQFGQLYAKLLPGRYNNSAEQIFAQPLLYTDSDGIQYVYVATNQNNVYKIAARTGNIVASRNLARPFLSSDLGACNDINPHIGSTATGVIDPATGTWYLTTKTYLDQSPTGANGNANARYYIHALSVADLSEKPSFPVNLENTYARNNPARWFTGGVHHQRPGFLLYNNWVYVGFASHCIQYNYTGWIMGFDKSSGQLVERWATEGAGVGPSQSGGGVWMSGGGISSDNSGSIWFATGNGGSGQLGDGAVDGRTPPTSFEEAVVHAAIQSDGTMSVVDFFMPKEKVDLDKTDKDLGTTPFQLLPSSFSCGSTSRIGMVTGKSGITYWLNADNLGGYKMGPNLGDNVPTAPYPHPNIVYSGAGAYPLEGGYVYVNVVNYPTRVFQFNCDSSTGKFSFTSVATTNENNSGTLGVGHGTVTSLNGQPGTGMFWVSDVQGGNLRIYSAVPQGGTLKLLNSFNANGVTKFTKLSFGDGIAFLGSTTGYLYAFGAPVNLPLDCTSLQFSPAYINSTSAAQKVQCQAKVDVTITGAALSGVQNFVVQNLPSLPVRVVKGSNFSFDAVFSPRSVGSLSSSVLLNTTQVATGYTNTTAVKLSGTGQSQNPLLRITPPVLTWTPVITGATPGGVNQTFILSNVGNTVLTISNIFFSTSSEKGPWITPNGTAAASQVSAFTFYGLPSSIPAGKDLSIPINFTPPASGSYAVFMRIESDGGNIVFDAFASGADQPKAVVEFETVSGGWVLFDRNAPFTFGDVKAGLTRSLRLRITNNGTKNAAPIALTVSKPPFGNTGSIIGTQNPRDLAEGTQISAGNSSYATLYCAAPRSQINVPAYNQTIPWTMNMNDPDFGHTLINFICNVVTDQYGPLDKSGQAIYQYAGCYLESTNKRQLPTKIGDSDTMTNELCVTSCSAKGYPFAGTQYRRECWCGGARPQTVLPETSCTFLCTGNANETCGGNGADGTGASISTFGDLTRWDGNRTNPSSVYVNPGAYGFSSIGCWTDTTGTRTLPNRVTANDTVGSCLKACVGSTYAGVEYGGECYCGNVVNSASNQTDLSDCNMGCNNNVTEPCGGPGRLNLYKAGVVTTSSTTKSTVSSTVSVTSSTIANSVSTTSSSVSSLSVSSSSSSSLASSSSSSSTTSIKSSSSTTTSTTILATTTVTSLTTSTISTTSTSKTSSTTITSASPGATSITNLGCATDNAGSRGLDGAGLTTDDMTVDKCINFCFKTKNMPYMAVEYSKECFCGYTLKSPSALGASSSNCNMACAGNSSQICGGQAYMNVYRLENYTPTSNKPTLSDNYKYQGCYRDNVNNKRTLSGYNFADSSNMTQELCVSTCKTKGYGLAGVEYASECWCASSSSVNLSTATKAANETTECNMQCSGNSLEWCGGSARLNIWAAT